VLYKPSILIYEGRGVRNPTKRMAGTGGSAARGDEKFMQRIDPLRMRSRDLAWCFRLGGSGSGGLGDLMRSRELGMRDVDVG